MITHNYTCDFPDCRQHRDDEESLPDNWKKISSYHLCQSHAHLSFYEIDSIYKNRKITVDVVCGRCNGSGEETYLKKIHKGFPQKQTLGSRNCRRCLGSGTEEKTFNKKG